jgi:ATP-dependent DNA ligase
LGRHLRWSSQGQGVVYAGKVDHGFDKTSAAALRKRLTPLIRKTQPCAKKIAHRDIWVEPEMPAGIEYWAKSAEGKVRHPLGCGRTCDGHLRRRGLDTMDIEDLRSEIEHGRSIEEAAKFLCRTGSIDEVAKKCRELGLHSRLE